MQRRRPLANENEITRAARPIDIVLSDLINNVTWIALYHNVIMYTVYHNSYDTVGGLLFKLCHYDLSVFEMNESEE